ncbi:MAG: acylphosphatase [Flavitalea sp.]
MPRIISIIVTGKVQRVNFRKKTQEEAIRLGITGTIKNVGNNEVHIEAIGEPEPIDHFINWCKKGPELATVESIQVKDISQRNFGSFNVIRNRNTPL